MSYVGITQKMRDLLKVAFPYTTPELIFKLKYFDDGTCEAVASNHNGMYFRGSGADPCVAANKMFENFREYLGALEAMQTKALDEFTEKQTKCIASIRLAREGAQS